MRFVVLIVLAAGATARAAPAGHQRLGDLDCGDCHATAGWTVSGGKGFDHARTGFPLSGAHADTACAACHSPERAITRACAGCHADPHEARLGTACDVCHGPVSFRDTRARERHARTRLPLSGMHALLDCTACHPRGTARTWSDVPADCIACHEADYRRPGLHPVHDGSGGAAPFPLRCELCHRATAFAPAVIRPALLIAALSDGERRAHERRFPIQSGRHRGIACAGCHAGEPRAGTAVCAGCHARAQHRRDVVAGEGTCLACHPRGTR